MVLQVSEVLLVVESLLEVWSGSLLVAMAEIGPHQGPKREVDHYLHQRKILM